MKKVLLLALFLLISPIAAMAQVSPAADIDPSGQAVSSCVDLANNMRYRTRDVNTNGEVSILQDFLNTKGYLNSEPTGFFGVATLFAVRKFQSSVGLAPTGYVGALTRAKIKAMTCGGTDPSVATSTEATKTQTGDISYQATPAGSIPVERGKFQTFWVSISNAPANAPILLYLQRPDGSFKYNGYNTGRVTNAQGQWISSIYQFLTLEGQNGTWTSWVSIGGRVSEKRQHQVISSSVSASSLPAQAPIVVNVQNVVQYGTDSSSAFITTSIGAGSQNKQVTTWDLQIKCPTNVTYLFPSKSDDSKDSICGTTQKYSSSNYYDITQGVAVLTAGATNTSNVPADITYLLTAYDASGRVVGRDSKSVSLAPLSATISSPVATTSPVVSAPVVNSFMVKDSIGWSGSKEFSWLTSNASGVDFIVDCANGLTTTGTNGEAFSCGVTQRLSSNGSKVISFKNITTAPVTTTAAIRAVGSSGYNPASKVVSFTVPASVVATKTDFELFNDCIYQSTTTCIKADFNKDGLVNFADLAEMKSALKYDMNGDNIINLTDATSGTDLDLVKGCFYQSVVAVVACAKADFNKDGIVNVADLALFKSAVKYDLNGDSMVTYGTTPVSPSVIVPVKVLSPNGGESVAAGGTLTVTWSGESDASVIDVSMFPWAAQTDSTRSYTAVASTRTTQNTRSATLTLPATLAAGQYFVRLICMSSCAPGPRSAFDDSDAPFSVTSTTTTPSLPPVSTPVITSVNPLQITAGKTTTVTLSGSKFNPTLMVGLTGPGADTSISPVSVSPDGTSMTFNFPATITTPGTYSVQVLNFGIPTYSSINVTLVAPFVPAPTVTLTASPMNITSGQTALVSWTSRDATSCFGFDGPYGAWWGAKGLSGSVVTPILTASTKYTLSCSGTGGTTSSSATVSVSTPAVIATTTTAGTTATRVLTILSPNGGEILPVGSVQTIRWNSSNIDKVSIGWTTGPGSLNWIATNIPNTGSYDWTVNVGNTANTQFKISIIGYQTGVGSVTDESDNYFTVTKATAANFHTTQLASVIDAFAPDTTASVIPQTPVFTYRWDHDLQIGSSYFTDVAALQTALTRQGLFSDELSGGFYDKTFVAVKQFQQKYGIDPTGFVGERTRATLNQLYH